jgi:hypothetical protein
VPAPSVTLAWMLSLPGNVVLAYVGLGPGQEFIPSFLALLGLTSAALLAILQWPLLALRRHFQGGKRDLETESRIKLDSINRPSESVGDRDAKT